MELTQEEALRIAKERGLVPQDYQLPKSEISQEEALKIGIERGLIKPREDGAGFKTRTKFSFADTDKGRKQVLEDKYGKGNAYKIGDRWLINEGKNKGWNYVDENKLSWKDVADIAGDSLETIGAGAGGVMGTPLGGAGSVAGASLGGAIGRTVKKVGANLWGINDNQDMADVAKDIGESALYSGIGQGVGNGLGWAVNKALSPYKSSMTPEAIARRELASKYNIELTPADIVQKPSLSRVENFLNSGITGDNISAFKRVQFSQLQDELAKTLEDISKNKTNESVGIDIVKALENKMKDTKNSFIPRYQEIANNINQEIPLANTKSTANSIIDSNSKVPLSLQGQSLGTSNEMLALPDTVDYGTLSKIRTALGEKATGGNITGDIGISQYKMLKGSIDKDFNDFAINNGLGDAKKLVDADYKAFKDNYEQGIVNKVLKSDINGSIIPEKVGNNVISTITNAKKVGENLQDKTLLQEAIANDLASKSKVSNSSLDTPFSNYFSTDKLNTAINKNKDVYDYAMSSSQKDKLGDMVDLGSIIGQSQKAYGNPSGTAKALDGILNSSAMFYEPTLALTSLAGRYAGSKAYTSDLGRKWLTDGLGEINPKYNSFGAVIGSMQNK